MTVIALRGHGPSAGQDPDRGEGRSWLTFAFLAALVEGALLLGVAAFLQHRPAPAARPTPMQILLEAPPVPKPVAQPKPPPHLAPPPPRPRVQPRIAKPPPPRLRRLPTPQPARRIPPPPPLQALVTPPDPAPSPPPPRIVAPPPVPQTIPAMPVAPPEPPVAPLKAPPVVDLQALRDAYGQAMHAAIQAVARYPDTARRMGLSGRTLVAFRFEHGEVHDVRIVTSSGSGVLDRAAERAVRDASYPALPVALQGKPLTLQLWIRFRLDAGSDE
ncbi:MAG: energy transducer TonB [Betaproteobacteria bacterium]|nr:energy transducer TonB [Betaproteobacteria bacterium]MDE2124891.1 energy transducer TonB [Betaproteobacteria bacterium]MDE2187842.1 energy transducer TonB [Betaproteobacteria bacterium]MDE2323703.1 energy transducer TonB [Betaproteobacteria bacterium]